MGHELNIHSRQFNRLRKVFESGVNSLRNEGDLQPGGIARFLTIFSRDSASFARGRRRWGAYMAAYSGWRDSLPKTLRRSAFGLDFAVYQAGDARESESSEGRR